jgi:transcriptional regulator with XRE-family HTH domain
MTIGERLKRLRENLAVSQSTVAKALGLAVSTLSQYETDKSKPDAEILVRIADYYDTSIDYICGRDCASVPTKNDRLLIFGEKLTRDDLRKFAFLSNDDFFMDFFRMYYDSKTGKAAKKN